eukprot:scaffold4844_cov112-Cylindrotheca_fusiformis.AAC.4
MEAYNVCIVETQVLGYHCQRIESTMKHSSATIFLRSLRLHRSGVRFLSAQYYVDAIHTILQGLELMEVSLTGRSDVSILFDRWTKTYPLEIMNRRSYMIDTEAMDHCCFAKEEWMASDLKPNCCHCEGFLVSAMVYNLALAYHQYALSHGERTTTRYSYLREALRIYSAAETLLRQHGLEDSIPPGLENNVRHILCSTTVQHDARSKLISWEPTMIPIGDRIIYFN